MNLTRFQSILDAYGASPERWPEEQRASALTLARSSVEAARALAHARALDAALMASEITDIADEPARFASLHDRILAAAKPLAKSWIGRWLGVDLTPAQLWPSLGGLALATVLGFVVGMGGLMDNSAQSDQDDTATPLLETGTAAL